MAHQPTMSLMLHLNGTPLDVSAGMIGVVGARHAVPLRLRQQQHTSASLVAQQERCSYGMPCPYNYANSNIPVHR